jgi:hypothetical protein
MMAMKKKKMYESQLEQVENNILRVNEQQMGLENMRVVVEAVDALRVGADAQKATMKVRGLRQAEGYCSLLDCLLPCPCPQQHAPSCHTCVNLVGHLHSTCTICFLAAGHEH